MLQCLQLFWLTEIVAVKKKEKAMETLLGVFILITSLCLLLSWTE